MIHYKNKGRNNSFKLMKLDCFVIMDFVLNRLDSSIWYFKTLSMYIHAQKQEYAGDQFSMSMKSKKVIT